MSSTVVCVVILKAPPKNTVKQISPIVGGLDRSTVAGEVIFRKVSTADTRETSDSSDMQYKIPASLAFTVVDIFAKSKHFIDRQQKIYMRFLKYY